MAIDITYSNEKEGIIEAETNGSIWSWGEEIYIKIKSKSGGGTEIKVESTASAQLFSWGKNSSNERTIIEGISERLGR